MSDPQTGEDHCPCSKGDDCWGQDGWHFFRMTKELFVRRYLERELGRLSPASRTDDMRRAIRQSAEAQAPTYEGMMTAYEPCPAYQNAARLKTIARKREMEASAKPDRSTLNPDFD